ncbi:hypothetical protein [Bradyrhizobium sp. CCBAU 53415]|uniref:hypothetical protein n=1 Tax=Bradyrhizobium sp. CCBAU 53415 TaxID=1325119 RepID=UPI0023055294|nr:hypothetical protein [Bradyrhizobium sp. CCBAU 53415]
MPLAKVASYSGYEPEDPMFQTTPDAIDAAVTAFGRELGAADPQYVDVRPFPGAELGMCQRNVLDHMRLHRGQLVHAWAIWANRLFLMGEFHAIWRSPGGELVDVTPTAEGEARVLCAIAEDYGENFDFALRPANRAMRTVDPVDPAAVADAIAALSPARRSYEQTRAARRGLDLETHIAAKLPLSDLAAAVDALIKCCELRDRLALPTRSGVYSKDPEAFMAVQSRMDQLHQRIVRLFAERDRGVRHGA